jgi:outer membrane protein assembly factor BamB
VLWRSHELFGSATPSLYKDDTILMMEIGDGPMSGIKAINAHDGTLKWNAGRTYMTRTSIGNEYAVLRGYGGAAQKINLIDGSFSKGLVKGGQLGGDTHACGAVGLTPLYSYAVTVGGLIVRDAETGEQIWQSPGFAPRACVNVSLANGRVFWPSAASGVFFCWEPQKD